MRTWAGRMTTALMSWRGSRNAREISRSPFAHCARVWMRCGRSSRGTGAMSRRIVPSRPTHACTAGSGRSSVTGTKAMASTSGPVLFRRCCKAGKAQALFACMRRHHARTEDAVSIRMDRDTAGLQDKVLRGSSEGVCGILCDIPFATLKAWHR